MIHPESFVKLTALAQLAELAQLGKLPSPNLSFPPDALRCYYLATELEIMIGRDEDNKEVKYTVSDRRKYNPDGSLKEGVDLGVKAEEIPVATAAKSASEPAAAPKSDPPGADYSMSEDDYLNDADDDDDFPGVDDPASFVNFLSTLATNAAAALGAVPHPATGQLSLDLETGKYWLDVLGMIQQKTHGNLHPRETKLLEGLLADLRMQYVTMVRATEDKLKAQAAQKFSGADILGKKV